MVAILKIARIIDSAFLVASFSTSVSLYLNRSAKAQLLSFRNTSALNLTFSIQAAV
jgi:hypothetical protein